MKRIAHRCAALIAALLLALTPLAAGADCVYSVLPAQIDTQALLQAAFGERANEARQEVREYGRLFWDIPDSDESGFCGYGAQTELQRNIQSEIDIYTAAFYLTRPEMDLSENIVPSGVADCKLTREDAVLKAQRLLDDLGIGEARLLSVAAGGRLPAYVPAYEVSFLQTLNGLPVYWCADVRADDGWQELQSHKIDVIYGDLGLLRLQGCLSRFEAQGEDAPVQDEAQALAGMRRYEPEADALERCYLLRANGGQAAAAPAYRWQNRFISALTGEMLQ